ncbi:uncharacterized protein LOC123383275 [Felis catus]|uniref:uncharacterized protein LOC123383275 n=1 Tax=Felis catus TaxID=9685 RepID=UPI001D19E7DE|nr:uncharacterized protein LOC123383275 [Felis catus]
MPGIGRIGKPIGFANHSEVGEAMLKLSALPLGSVEPSQASTAQIRAKDFVFTYICFRWRRLSRDAGDDRLTECLSIQFTFSSLPALQLSCLHARSTGHLILNEDTCAGPAKHPTPRHSPRDLAGGSACLGCLPGLAFRCSFGRQSLKLLKDQKAQDSLWRMRYLSYTHSVACYLAHAHAQAKHTPNAGAQHSVLRTPQGKLASKKSWVQGVTGMSQYSWTTRRMVDLGMVWVSHSFMVIPECPYLLLGRDLLTKIGAQITFRQGGPQVTDGKGHPIQVLTMKLEDEYRLHQEALPREDNIDRWLQEFPSVWAETGGGGIGLAAHRTPVLVELKPGESPVRIKQYPMSQEALKGIQPHIRRLQSLGVLIPCQSPWNTPLLPVKKPHTNDYRLVQDLREVNKRVTDIHPTVPNPYTLLSSLAPSRVWYTVLDLKDAFFSLPLAPQSQPLFAFEWHDPEEGYSGQLTWTRLLQGFKNSPTIFDMALQEDLGEYRREHPGLTLLQYVDDILIAANMAKDCE